MPQFTYQAKQGVGKSVQGTIEADTLDAAVDEIMKMGYAPIDVQPARVSKNAQARKSAPLNLRKKFRMSDSVFLTRQLSDLVGAGVPVLRALTLTGQQSTSSYLREVMLKMRDDVRDGENLSSAMSRHPEVFPRLHSNMVMAGERSGKLAEVLGRLADFAQRDLDTRTQVISSLIYPGIILGVGSLVVFGLLTFVVPKLAAIFVDLDQALPLPTIILITVSDFLAKFWWAAVLLVIFAVYGLNQFNQQPQGRLLLDGWKLRVPVMGALIRSVETGRFARTMSTLLKNGVAILTSLEVTALIMSNEVVRREVARMIDSVRDGSSLNAALRRTDFFPETVTVMVAVGEESGQVHEGLERMAEYFERQAQGYVKTLTTIIEPLLIFVLGLVVGFVILAMLMPLVRMNTIIQ